MTDHTRSPQWPVDARIGIVGAGASGLTTAHFLTEAGYKDIVLLEMADEVGGKCCSVTVNARVYELGAVLGLPSYAIIKQLMDVTDVEGELSRPSQLYRTDGRRIGRFRKLDTPRIAWQLGRYVWLTNTHYSRIYQPGLDDIHPDLCQTFADLADANGFSLLPELFGPVATGFGYGYPDEVPAAYLMKYIDWPAISAFSVTGGLFVWPEGIQTVWRRMADEYDVRLGKQIERVTRGRTVHVHTYWDDFEFDLLILACPLDNALLFLDASSEETDLFSRIHYFDYWVLLCEVDGLPSPTGFIPEHFSAENHNHAMIWYSRWSDSNLTTLYVLGDFQSSLDVIEANCAADLRRFGAELRQTVDVRRWRYFPHVTTRDMADSFYERLEALQGINRTYYTGEIMSFSTLECSARYAQHLVQRFFSPVPLFDTQAVPMA